MNKFNKIKKMTKNSKLGKKVSSVFDNGMGAAVDKMIMKAAPEGRSAANLWTGKRMKTGAAVGIGAAGIGIGVSAGSASAIREEQLMDGIVPAGSIPLISNITRPTPAPSARVESPGMLADGLSSMAEDLGTNGSMVFGMHNSRSGGYM